MTVRTFTPTSKARRICNDFLAGLIVAALFFVIAFAKAPRYPWLAVLIGLFAGLMTFAPLAYNEPEDLQSVEITAQNVLVSGKGERKSLSWNEITKAYFRRYEGTAWVLVSPGKSTLVFMLEGFTPKQEEAINSLIKMNLECNKVDIVR